MVKKITKTKYSYLEPFLDFTKNEIHLSEISKRIKEPHPTTRIYLNYFEKMGFLKKSHKGKLTLYSLNKENPLIIDLISLAEKDLLFRKIASDLILKEIVSFLHDNLTNKQILLFGSARTDTKAANDIDVLIIGKTRLSFNKLENKINKKIHLINVFSLSKINESLKEEIRKKHLLLEGTESLIKWLI